MSRDLSSSGYTLPQASQSTYSDPAQSSLAQTYTTSPPPKPPPKPESQAYAGPPPLPPPPNQSYAQQFSPPPPRLTPIQSSAPAIEEYWLPEIVLDKSKPDLETLLQSANLLSALVNAPSSTHPSQLASLAPLNSALETNTQLATHLNGLSSELASLRNSLTTRLLSLRALERQWRHKQSDMDTALEPWSPKALHARLVASIGEQEMLCRALEESFLESQDGRASEREVADWIKRYREGRMLLGLRKERRARFEEGRVGGWR